MSSIQNIKVCEFGRKIVYATIGCSSCSRAVKLVITERSRTKAAIACTYMLSNTYSNINIIECT